MKQPASTLFRLNLLRSAIVCILACSLAACAARPVAPEVSLADLQVSELTLTHANMLAGLRIFNPNPVALTVKEVDYTLTLNGIKVSSGRSSREVRIGAEEYGELTLRLSSAYWDLLRILNQTQAGGTVTFALDGKVKVGGFGIIGKTFRFQREGDIALDGMRP